MAVIHKNCFHSDAWPLRKCVPTKQAISTPANGRIPIGTNFEVNLAHLRTTMKLLLLVLLLLVAIPAFTQQDSVKITTPGDTVVVTETWTVRQLKQFARQQRRDSIRAHKKVWLSILGGPSTEKL